MSPESILDRWRERLKNAKLQLEFAALYLKEVREVFIAGNLLAPDGDFAYQRALREEYRARAEYMRVLRIVHDLVIDGKLPKESALPTPGFEADVILITRFKGPGAVCQHD